ncbi:hypothetical protein Ae168Ps1_0351 [Pseudonocardia sp. Ae168_Ps1]|uniref:hypothetical protein n=1 Tax=unclassified Pseudonocardia TaxID=2619320 RepID=UPI0009627E70|nr:MULTISPECIES: hypothetical protein [unclassified Pseudonocardia]OLL71978.1 hypothetical protein Ae150APs1_0356 [Pseudonocardia sp. Ae150A_Ps1]OLL77945.1 hypothetical protein Ae168Ps1_0351 [Pseudonocardia sp. Ae168_Ps1]OLL87932.1 hypothetical protein Ae263Ps1_4987c [Pseudonocardia sp. Ae263_Ps1]OLL92043.1 hypothetical protein Ae356Ps1_1940 [Pseudonocardia sp. Ae356_Ps1]
MGGRHRVPRAERRGSPWTAHVVLPLVAAVGVVATVVAVVTAGGLLAERGADAPRSGPGTAALSAPLRPRTAPPITLPAAGGAADAAAAAARAATDRASGDTAEDDGTDDGTAEGDADPGTAGGGTGTGVCDLDGPPRFDDPQNPEMITNRDCGYVDDQGRERSRDPWIDDQLRQMQDG